MKKTLCITLCVALMASVLLVLPASAATNSNKSVVRPIQYTSAGPNDSGVQIVYKETFDGISSPEAAGYFPGYQDFTAGEIANFIPACDLKLTSGHSGKGLLVTNRQKVYAKKSKSGKVSQLDHQGGEFSFVLTNHYPKQGTASESSYVDANGNFLKAYEQVTNEGGGKDIGAIIGKYVDDVTDKQDVSFFFSMWVYTDTAQTFLPKIQYMNSGELWIPADDYWEVPAKKWTQIGAIVDNGKTYYCSMVGEGGTEAYGMYGLQATTTDAKFCMATKSKDANGLPVFTHGDYIIDDVTIWKVTDKAKLFNMQYTMLDKSVKTGLDGLVEIDNKDNIASKKVVNAFAAPKTTAKKTPAKTTAKKPVATKAPTTAVKVVKETNAAGKVIGTKKVIVTEAAATATGTGTGTGTGTETATATATGTGTATATAAIETQATATVTNASGEPVEPEEKGSLLWLWIVLGVVVLGGGATAGIVLGKKKGDAPAEEAAEEAPAEEKPEQ